MKVGVNTQGFHLANAETNVSFKFIVPVYINGILLSYSGVDSEFGI